MGQCVSYGLSPGTLTSQCPAALANRKSLDSRELSTALLTATDTIRFQCEKWKRNDVHVHQQALHSRRLCMGRRGLSPEMETHSDKDPSLGGADRALLTHSPVELRSGWRRQKLHFYLFSDCLLVSNAKYRKRCKIK